LDSPPRALELQGSSMMWQVLGSMVDVVHALLMATWVLGLPLLFIRRWPSLTRAYGIYAISFILVSQLSQLALGECFLTTIARALWQRSSSGVPIDTNDWFTVRIAKWVFELTPSHRAISLVSELLILLTAVGALLMVRQRRSHWADRAR
jgi:hypothetical protein